MYSYFDTDVVVEDKEVVVEEQDAVLVRRF
jgi:hypothetical protein